MPKRSTPPQHDVIVIGAGITGMYQVYMLRNAGLKVRGIEAGSDVGGTWYWNRYPGCRLDTESYAYGYFALKGILPDWEWGERFASQPELLRYAQSAADAMEIRSLYQFNVRVEAANYDEAMQGWRLRLSDGSETSCRFLVSAVGPLSATRMPNIPGIDSFEGQSFHTSRWPRDECGQSLCVDFSGKRVGVIGTGATGVQVIPIVAAQADRLHVFQRTPNWCIPLGNHPLTPELVEQLRGDPQQFVEFLKTTDTAFPYTRSRKKAIDATSAEREALFESLYDMPGYGLWLSAYRDLLTNKASNDFMVDFVASKIRQRVEDPQVAEKLIPHDHAFGTRRVPMETRYYEVYNQPHVELVDIREHPIEAVTPTGIRVGGRDIALDVLIYATGFDGVTGSLDRIDIRGVGGRTLKQAWADGPSTYLGIQSRGFPNFFTLVGAHNGASFCNVGVCGALQVEWLTEMLAHMHANDLRFSEPVAQYEADWTRHVYEVYAQTLLADTDAWWVRTTPNADGSLTRRALIYVGGAPDYRERCAKVAQNGYEGFLLA
jgi:cation diffusion facilitator CzcD-associated flavoprotein CzcO